MNRVDRAMQVLRNLPRMAVTTAEKTGMIPKDELRNRALRAINTIKKSHEDKRKVDKYMREAWVIYKRLQNLVGRKRCRAPSSPRKLSAAAADQR